MVLRGALELERQHVQQHFAVGVGVDVAKIELEELALQLFAVGQVAVVAERHAERRIDVERLRLGIGIRGAGGGIAAMADAGGAHEVAHVAGTEHVLHESRSLVHVENRTLAGDDARGVLAAVLQQQEAVVEQLVDRRMRDDADDATHESTTPFSPRGHEVTCGPRGNNQAAAPIRTVTRVPASARRSPAPAQGPNSATN